MTFCYKFVTILYESMVYLMKDIINIENENLANYIMFKLDKVDNSFTEEELNEITEVVIDYNNETDSSFIFLEELLKLKNLKTITLRNGYIFNANFTIFLRFVNLSEIVFENCEFENADLIASLRLKSLSLINCNINDYSFVYEFENLEELSIINGVIEIEKINKLKHLKYLQLSYSNIIDNNILNTNNVEEIYIDNTNISNFNFLNNLINLKKASIDVNQYNNNQELFNNLMKKNIIVLNEDMVEFGGENDEI